MIWLHRSSLYEKIIFTIRWILKIHVLFKPIYALNKLSFVSALDWEKLLCNKFMVKKSVNKWCYNGLKETEWKVVKCSWPKTNKSWNKNERKPTTNLAMHKSPGEQLRSLFLAEVPSKVTLKERRISMSRISEWSTLLRKMEPSRLSHVTWATKQSGMGTGGSVGHWRGTRPVDRT